MDLRIEIMGAVDAEEINKEFQALPFAKVENIKVSKFSGLSILLYLLTFSGGVAIAELTKIINKIIDKDNAKSVKINDIEVKGYNYRQTKKLLGSLLKYKEDRDDGNK